MKIFVMTLGLRKFEIEVKPEDKVADLKRTIESVPGADVYPSARQMLIHKEKLLEDDTTLEENEIAENSSITIMLSRDSSAGESTAYAAPSSQPASTSRPASSQPSAASEGSTPIVSVSQSTPATAGPSASTETNISGQAASHIFAGSNLDSTIQLFLDLSRGRWDRDTVVSAVRAYYDNQGIPEQARFSQLILALSSAGRRTNPAAQAQQPAEGAPTGSPNTSPLEHSPRGSPANRSGSVAHDPLDSFRNTPRFQVLRPVVRAYPPILQRMLEALEEQDPPSLRLIQRHQADFLSFINESNVGNSYILGLSPDGAPQYVTVTTQQQQAIERLEAMGFERNSVLAAFFACNMNEELAAIYLLDHMD